MFTQHLDRGDVEGDGPPAGLGLGLTDVNGPAKQILWSGNTGRSGAPHVHLEIRAGGEQRCPQPLLQSLYSEGVGLDPATLPTNGCWF